MSVRVAWDNPKKTALRIDCEGPWDWAEYARVVEEAIAGLIGEEQTANFIINLLSEARTPVEDGRSSLEHPIRLLLDITGFVVVVGGSPSVGTLPGALFRTFTRAGKPAMLALSVEEARLKLAALAYVAPTPFVMLFGKDGRRARWHSRQRPS